MNLEQLRAKLAGILAKLDGLKAQDGSFNDEQMSEVDALHAEFETTKKQIETAEKIEAMSAKAGESTRKVAPTPVKAEVGEDRRILDPKGGFNNQGEFFKAVAKAALSGNSNVDKRLTIQAAGMKEAIGEEGGFLIPSYYRS
jgi:HK97 family phage major capsid protein